MNKNKVIAVLMAGVLLLSLTACGKGKGGEDLAPSDYLPDITPPLNVAITDCLSADEVSVIMGVPMTASEPYEHGTWVIYSSADSVRQVSVSMENTTVELYDAMIAGLDGGEKSAEVSDRAYWYAQRGELINFCAGYSIAITVTDPMVINTYGLCQAVAKKLADNLQTK